MNTIQFHVARRTPVHTNSRRALTAALAFLLCLPSLTQAADVSFYGLFKGQSFIQDNPVGPRLTEIADPLFFETFVNQNGINTVTSGTVRLLPDGAPLALQSEDGSESSIDARFDGKLALDATYPAGEYRLDLVTVNEGSKPLVLSLLPDAYPNPPRISNFTAAQNINSGLAFTLQWNALQGGTANDFIKLEIEDLSTGNFVFETGEPGASTALDVTDVSVDIPADTLVPGRAYRVYLMFVKTTDIDTTSYSGATGFAGYISECEIVIRTAGIDTSDNTAPSVSVSPDGFNGVVPVNSAIAFHFSEPMNTTIDIPASIVWNGVDGADFTYTWNSRGDRLFAIHDGALPTNTEISWTLNQAGSEAFEDLNGNLLPTESGFFTTTTTSNFGSSDVSFLYLIKGRGLIQDSATTEEDGDCFLDLGTVLSGYNTVTHVILTLPGGGVVTVEPDSSDQNLEFEAGYTFKAVLDSFFPNGAYSIALHTIHDGVKTIPLTLSPDAYPNAPTLSDLPAAQAINPAVNYPLTWNAFADGDLNDFIFVEVEKISANSFDEVFASPDPGVGSLNGESVNITIPAYTLSPGRDYETILGFVKFVNSDDTTYLGMQALAGFTSETEFGLHTAGEIITPQIGALGISGGQFRLRLTGERNVPYIIKCSTDLVNWFDLDTYTSNTSLPGTFVSQMDLNFPASGPKRFYRALENLSPFGGGNPGGGDPGWSLLFTTAIAVTPCNGGIGPLFFGGANIQVGIDGSFDTLLTRGQEPYTNEPVVRIHGTLGASFQANLNCHPGGSLLTTLTAAAQSGGYYGSFSSGASSGSLWVVTQTGMISIHGRVTNSSNNPVAGALISTSLDGQTATSDSNGAFFLQTVTPANSANQTSYQILVNGVTQGNQNWGDYPRHLSLTFVP